MYENNDFNQYTPKNNSSKAIKAVALIIASILVLSLGVFLGSMLNKSDSEESSYSTPIQDLSAALAVDVSLTVAKPVSDSSEAVPAFTVTQIAKAVMPSMVAITNITVQEVKDYFGFYGQNKVWQTQSSGSGIIIGKNETELLIVTNNHVIENATTLSVCFADNTPCEALLKGCAPEYDLAVIGVKLSSIPDETFSNISIAQIGNSTELEVGMQVVAIGNALGYGQSVTTGIVSALNRRVDSNLSVMLQTDAAINPGNSGGALLDMQGNVVGINSAKYSSTEVEGIGYAIAITEASEVIERLMNTPTREKADSSVAAYIGISGQDVSAEIEETYGIPQGIYINGIVKNSAAHSIGLSSKSVITHFDGTKMTSADTLKNRLDYYRAGEKVTLTVQVYENGKYTERSFEIILDSRPSGKGNTF